MKVDELVVVEVGEPYYRVTSRCSGVVLAVEANRVTVRLDAFSGQVVTVDRAAVRPF